MSKEIEAAYMDAVAVHRQLWEPVSDSRDTRRVFGMVDLADDAAITPTMIVQEAIFRIHTRLADDPGFQLSGEKIASLVEGYHITMQQNKPGEALNHHDAADILMYAASRLVSKGDISLLGEGTHIHLTDDTQTFMGKTDLAPEETHIPDKRARLYQHEKRADETTHLSFLLRTSLPDSNTDAHEIIILTSFIEQVKIKIRQAFAEDNHQALEKYRTTLENLSGKTWDTAQVKEWSSVKNQITLESDIANQELLKPWEIPSKVDNEHKGQERHASRYTARKIKEALVAEKVSVRKLVLGNDFTLPLSILAGQLSEGDIRQISREIVTQDNTDFLTLPQLESLEKKGQELVKQFAFLQFVTQYKGDNAVVNEIKQRINDLKASFQKRLLGSKETPLGSPVDYIDFAAISDKVINDNPDDDFRRVLKELKAKGEKILQIAYPLGDGTYSLIEAIDDIVADKEIQVGIKDGKPDMQKDMQYAFLGKVGFIVNESNNVVNIGRVVSAERGAIIWDAALGIEDTEQFNNFENTLDAKEDFLIIPSADETEIIVCVDGVTLQSREDALILREKIAKQFDKDPKQITMILDMESAHLQRIMKKLGKRAAIAYYVSDHTKIIADGKASTLAKSMGPKGTLASLTSTISVVYKLVMGK